MTQHIKVLHTEWSDGWGGQEIRIINEMIALREKGVEVALACREHAKIKDHAQQHGFEVFIVPFKGSYHIPTIMALYKLIKKHGFNIVNTHSGKDTWTGGLAAKIAGAKFIRTRHLSNKINPSRFNFINELADFIFTTGESVRKDMIHNNRIQPKKILSVPTGIDERLFDPSCYDRTEERKKLGLLEHEIAIGIIAVIRQFKRHDLFIEAAEQLINEYNHLKFIIAGDGPRRQSMETLVKEKNLQKHILFLGHVKTPANVLAALDIFTLTSDSKEGVPQSVMQALMMNKKVVATNAGSTCDLHNNDNFLLIETGNLQAIIENLKCMIENDNETYTSSREYIVNHFSKNIMAEKIFSVYNQLLDTHA